MAGVPPTPAMLAPDVVAISDYGQSIGVVDFATGKILIILHQPAERRNAPNISSLSASNTSSLAFSDDGTRLLSGSEDGRSRKSTNRVFAGRQTKDLLSFCLSIAFRKDA